MQISTILSLFPEDISFICKFIVLLVILNALFSSAINSPL